MIRVLLSISFAGFVMILTIPVFAQENAAQKDPLEITADHTLEWHRNDKKYIARGNVIAKQGEVTIHGDLLTADYRESEEKSMDIYRLTAQDNVKIISRGNTAIGARAIYDVDSGKATMTGNNLEMRSADQTVTAKDRFEYHLQTGRLSAIGDAVVIRGEDRLEAQKVTAIFKENAQGKREIETLTAEGGVLITTPEETLQGESGIYRAATNTAEVTGNVTIKRGPNILQGQKAEVNLTTNVSKMTGGLVNSAGTGVNDTNDGRVRGVFFPGTGDSNPLGGSRENTP